MTFTAVNSIVSTVKPVWTALADNGAIVPGAVGSFVAGNPRGQLNTIQAKAWPKGAESWEPTSTGATIRTATGKATLPDMVGTADLLAAGIQEALTHRTSEVTGVQSATIEGKELAAVLLALAPVAAGHEKAVISNILLRFNPGASVAVATDGYKLVERVMPDVNGATFDALIDARDAKHLASILKADGYPLCRVSCVDTRLTIVAGNVAYFGPAVVYGEYPRYEQIIPGTFESNRIVVNVKELLVAVKQAKVKGCKATKLEAASGYGLKLSTVSMDTEANAHCSADVCESWEANFDLTVLESAIKGLTCESLIIYPSVSKLSPIVLRPLSGACRAIVMPVNK